MAAPHAKDRVWGTYSLVARAGFSFAAGAAASLGLTSNCQSTGVSPFCDCILRASLRASASASSSEVGPPLRLRVVEAEAEAEAEVDAVGAGGAGAAVLRTGPQGEQVSRALSSKPGSCAYPVLALSRPSGRSAS